MKGSILVLLFIFLLPFIQCTDCGNFTVLDFFNIQGMNGAVLIDRGFTKADTITEDKIIQPNELNNLIIKFTVTYLADQNISGSFGSLWACSPPENGTSGSKTEKFSSIEIKTLTDYSETYKAGSVINKILKIENYRTPTEDIDSIVLLQNNVKDEFLDLRFMDLATINGPKQFDVKIVLNTGEIYTWLSQRFITNN